MQCTRNPQDPAFATPAAASSRGPDVNSLLQSRVARVASGNDLIPSFACENLAGYQALHFLLIA